MPCLIVQPSRTQLHSRSPASQPSIPSLAARNIDSAHQPVSAEAPLLFANLKHRRQRTLQNEPSMCSGGIRRGRTGSDWQARVVQAVVGANEHAVALCTSGLRIAALRLLRLARDLTRQPPIAHLHLSPLSPIAVVGT